MKSVVALIVILIILAVIPAPYVKTTTSCTDQMACQTKQEFGWGDSLFQTIFEIIRAKNPQ